MSEVSRRHDHWGAKPGPFLGGGRRRCRLRYPRGAILPAYDPLMDSKSVRHILVRHEQGAGHAAEGYAYSSGKVGVCMATSGPVPPTS